MTYTQIDGEEGEIRVGCAPAPGTTFVSVTLTGDDVFKDGFADWFNQHIAVRMTSTTKKETLQ